MVTVQIPSHLQCSCTACIITKNLFGTSSKVEGYGSHSRPLRRSLGERLSQVLMLINLLDLCGLSLSTNRRICIMGLCFGASEVVKGVFELWAWRVAGCWMVCAYFYPGDLLNAVLCSDGNMARCSI